MVCVPEYGVCLGRAGARGGGGWRQRRSGRGAPSGIREARCDGIRITHTHTSHLPYLALAILVWHLPCLLDTCQIWVRFEFEFVLVDSPHASRTGPPAAPSASVPCHQASAVCSSPRPPRGPKPTGAGGRRGEARVGGKRRGRRKGARGAHLAPRAPEGVGILGRCGVAVTGAGHIGKVRGCSDRCWSCWEGAGLQ